MNRGKCKLLKIKVSINTNITVQGKALEEVERFTYTGGILDNNGETDTDIKTSKSKGQAAFHQNRNTQNSGK